MKVLILGGDGYLGWPTAMHFSRAGYDVALMDSTEKRRWEAEVGSAPLWPVPMLHARTKTWRAVSGKEIAYHVFDIAKDERNLFRVIEEFQPDAIIHYAEQPSAPYSMMGVNRAAGTQVNNVVGTVNVLFAIKGCAPNAHLVKLGTMGEYGTPNIRIEEGWLEVDHAGRHDRVLYPKKPGSFYHLSKVHDSHNIEFACRIWGLRATDLNQGVVYGIETEETKLHQDLRTSFHYDDVFGTVLNRFCVQAVAGIPLTVYGKGGQRRGFLNIRDTLKCVKLAVDHPPKAGEFRVFNQFTEIFSVRELAETVRTAAKRLGISAKIESIDNPRVEADEHYYEASNESLLKLGLQPIRLSEELVDSMLAKIQEMKSLIDPTVIFPRWRWNMNK